MWPRQPLKHFTTAYRGVPSCTQSQYPISRETGYSNVRSAFFSVLQMSNVTSSIKCLSDHVLRIILDRAFSFGQIGF